MRAAKIIIAAISACFSIAYIRIWLLFSYERSEAPALAFIFGVISIFFLFWAFWKKPSSTISEYKHISPHLNKTVVDANAEAQKILDKARSDATKLREEAQSAQTKAAETLDKALIKAQKIGEKATAKAHLEAQQLIEIAEMKAARLTEKAEAKADNANKRAEQIIEKSTMKAHIEAQQIIEAAEMKAARLTDGAEAAAKKVFDESKDLLLKEEQSTLENLEKAREELNLLKEESAGLSLELAAEDLSVTSCYLDIPSEEIKNKLVLLHTKQESLIKSGQAVDFLDDEKSIGIQTQARQLLRCFNAECTNIFSGLNAKSLDATMAKVKRSFDALNRLYLRDQVQLEPDFLALKLDELNLIYSCRLKEEEEREQRRAIREQMAEEEKVRRELERATQKLEKEEAQFSNEVRKLMGYMQKSKDDIERQLYIDKINELEEQLRKLRSDKEDIAHREQNTRAGFVYIISNIGSFGENVYKIGMTRRLEPLDRIAELSSASVPFKFDVHALIFSDDAPALETILHQTFSANQVNRVNPRKEFFRVDLEEIKRIVRENHDATVKFVDIPDAFEYRESIRMAEANEAPDYYPYISDDKLQDIAQ